MPGGALQGLRSTLSSRGDAIMRKVFGLAVMFGLVMLSLAPRASLALTPEQQACLRDCIGTYHGCSLFCAESPDPQACDAQCAADYSDCRAACLS
jgi:hypothetical protein